MSKSPAQQQPHDIVFFPPPDSALGQHYRYVTQRPWPSLLFVLPMLLIFEIGTWLRNGHASAGDSQLVAMYLIDMMIKALGASGAYFPGLLMVVILLAIHIVGKHPWKFDIYVLPAMLGESMVWTIPMFVFDRVLHTAIVAGQAPVSSIWLDDRCVQTTTVGVGGIRHAGLSHSVRRPASSAVGILALRSNRVRLSHRRGDLSGGAVHLSRIRHRGRLPHFL